jgi:hypothetical protein
MGEDCVETACSALTQIKPTRCDVQLFKIQCEWTWVHGVVLLLSFGTWLGVAYIVSASVAIDFDFYFVRPLPAVLNTSRCYC